MKPEKIEAKTKKLYEASVMEIVLLHYQKSWLMCHLDTQNSLEPLQILGCGNIF